VTTPERWACVDGNEAAARVAYALSEVIAIYPITPASPMGELADAWGARRVPNLWDAVPEVIEMQSEAGAAGALHGSAQRGALVTTFTASQGLLLMLPNMFKMAGELLPAVLHVAARTVATHALSIFGDHSDVMAVRASGFALLAASSVQEAHDFALIAHAATLASRVPFLHFFDGFRTSHEINRIRLLDDADLRALVDEAAIAAHRRRALSPEQPVLRGSAQNPDVFFQGREAANAYHDAVPATVATLMERLAERTGRRYGLIDYVGSPEATRVMVLMGSGAGAAEEAVRALCARGEQVGLVTVRLYRPFPADALADALPRTVRSVVVLDRTKEPGALGEPLYQDVVTALAEQGRPLPVIGGRYGLASKEFTPAMVKASLDELDAPAPRNHFTVGIVDDVTHTSLELDPSFTAVRPDTHEAVFYGLGSDGTVGANKATVKIVGDETDLWVQGYFVYDSKKSGSVTVSHLRFSPEPITSTYLVQAASFVACHQFSLVSRLDILERAAPGATLLLNCPHPADRVWEALPADLQRRIIDLDIKFYAIDADRVAREVGLPGRINSVMQPCYFAISGLLPTDRALAAIRSAIAKAYANRGQTVVDRNLAAVDQSLAHLHRIDVPSVINGLPARAAVPAAAPDFVQRVTSRMLEGKGDLLPVSALPVDGTFPIGTARFERRGLALDLPVWDPELCIDCGKCAIVCPHAAIRMKVYEPEQLEGAPPGFLSKPFRSRDLPGRLLTVQVAPDDCTGCGVCIDVCPARSKEQAKHKALDQVPIGDRADAERPRWEFFKQIPELDRELVSHDSVKTSQLLEPLFEFSGACAGCGETPYLKLLTQLFGDHLVVANATGCSSIYGGNLPTTPWTANQDGRGPAWANSLFEDNAEFGLGMRLAVDQQADAARDLLRRLAPAVGPRLADAILDADQRGGPGITAQRGRVAELLPVLERLAAAATPEAADAARLALLADALIRKSIWIVGGDGWAYDIGFSGLDHALATGRDVNILVLDTEVYSNTGAQASKSTPRGAVAKFASSGKGSPKKDLGMIAAGYGNVYVAQTALGGSDVQSVKAMLEADAWPGPSLILAYSTCIAHGIDMATSMTHQKDAVRSGYWPLYRYHPGAGEHDQPFSLDSHDPALPIKDFMAVETRYSSLARTQPERAAELLRLAQADADERWRFYRQLAGVERRVPETVSEDGEHPATRVQEDVDA
jgi:pyruvate-ferredoxin/flavodoxin oxidoreductase